MNIGYVGPAIIGPEDGVLKLKPHRGGGVARNLSKKEKPGVYLGSDAGQLQFVVPPQRHAFLLQPSGGFFENIHHNVSVLSRCLSNLDFSRSRQESSPS